MRRQKPDDPETTTMAQRDQLDSVRAHTPLKVNTQIDIETAEDLDRYAVPQKPIISHHISVLEREWDVDRYVELTGAGLALAGLALGIAVNRKWLALPALTAGMLLQNSLTGWCSPVSLFRRLGVRTRKEIDEEKFALKALRGDFEEVDLSGDRDYAIASSLQAVRR